MIINLDDEFRRVEDRLRGLERITQQQLNQDVNTASRIQNADLLLQRTDIERSQPFINEIDRRIDEIIVTSDLLEHNTVDISPLALQVLNFRLVNLTNGPNTIQGWSFGDLALFNNAGGWAIGTIDPLWVGNEYVFTLAQLQNIYREKTGSGLVKR